MSEELLENMLPKSLLVIGNGFDLSCGLPSNYEKFLKTILIEKTSFEETLVFDTIKLGLEEYLTEVNFFHDTKFVVKHTINTKYKIIQELNVWYIIFLYKNMIHNSEWYLVENQISDELLEDKNSLKIVEKIGDTLLSIYTEQRNSTFRTPVYCAKKIEDFKTDDLINRIYQFIAYSLLNKNLNQLDIYETKKVYKELREKVEILNEEYVEISNSNQVYGESKQEMFEKKIVSVLFPLVAQTLLAELNELELDFKNYLNRSIKSSNGEYEKNADSYIKDILNSVYYDRNHFAADEKFNILSFNYTTPWKKSSDPELFKNLFESINIHGELSNNNGMIFGIDDKKLLPTQDEYIFAKISRTLDLNTKNNSRITFDKLLSSNIENVIFYGHSLSIADYGYFRMIFEKYLERENVIFYFVFKVYPGTTVEKERKKLIKSISELFGEYSIDKENNTDIFKKLIQNQRIRIIDLDNKANF